MLRCNSSSFAYRLFVPTFGIALFLGCGSGSVGPGALSEASPTISRAGVTSVRELAKVLDLSGLPSPKGTEFNTKTAAEVVALVPMALEPAVQFYLKAMADKGFKPSSEPNSQTITAEYAQASLAKNGHAVSLSVIPGAENKVMVSLHRHGNLDARALPKSEGAKPTYGSSTLSMYVAKGSVAEESESLRKSFRKAGWQQYTQPNAAILEDPQHWQFAFRNQGYMVSGSVGVAPAQDNKTVVQYQVRTLAHELPAPPDATKVEFDDDDLVLKCETPGDLESVEKFYTNAMPAAGYKQLQHDEPRDKSRLLRYETEDKGIFLVSLRTEDHKTTQVEFIYYSPKLLEKMRKVAEKPNEPTPAESKPKDKLISAKDIPLPVAAKDIKYDAIGEEIKFSSDDSIKSLIDSLREKLTTAGWQEQKEATVAEENAGAMLLHQGDATLTIMLINLGLGGDTTATISTSGLNWQSAEKE